MATTVQVNSISPIGNVVALSGTARATNPGTGVTRDLQLGDEVFAEEVLTTARGSALAIQFLNGSRFDMGGNSEMALDAEVVDQALLAGETVSVEALEGDDAQGSGVTSDIDAIQQALLAGADPTELEATAAGAGGGGEDDGSSFVLLSRSNQRTTPESGFDTDPVGVAFGQLQPELVPEEEEEAAPAEVSNLLPVANDDVGAMFEDDDGVTIPELNDILGDGQHVRIISGGLYGSLSFDENSNSWVYVPNQDFNYLADGESLQDVFEYLLIDADGDSDPATVTITIIGTNDAPRIELEGTNDRGAVRERVEDAEDEMIAVLGDAGAIAFSDVDLSDTHSASVVASSSTHSSVLGSLVLGIVDQDNHSIGWSYTVSDAAVNFLREGQPVVETFTVEVADGKGGTARQNVVITITGSNDRPVISGVASGTVVEDGDSDADERTAQTASGQLNVADDDVRDQHAWSFDAAGTTDHPLGTIFGAFSVDANGLWTYVLNNALAQQLAANETYRETYTVNVRDDSGVAASDTASQQVVITIIGTNDAPVIISEGSDAEGAVRERVEDAEDELSALLTDSGDILYSDVDLADTHTVAIIGEGSTHGSVLGKLLLGDVDQANKTVSWTYSVSDAAVNFLREGQPVVETFTVEVSDGKGGTTRQNVVITITGSNDRPVISGVTSGTVVEDGDSDANANTSQTASGQLTVADDDVRDQHTWSLDASRTTDHPLGTIFGTFSVDANGLWTYVLNNALAQQLASGETYRETYTVNVRDDSGVAASDTASQQVVITIIGTNDAPVVRSAFAVVSEEGLAWGNPDNAPLGSDTTNAREFSGQLSISDADSSAFTVSLVKPADGTFKSGGVNVVWALSQDAKTLTGYAGPEGSAILRIVVTDSGAYTVTLLGQADHPVANVEDNFSFDVTINVSDRVASVPATLTITVEDDSPVISLVQDGIMTNQAGVLTGQLLASFGGDRVGGSYDLSGSIAKAPAGLVYTVTNNPDGSSVLVAYVGSVGAGKEYFSLTVNDSGTYAFELINPVPVTTTDSLLSYVKPGNYKDGVTSEAFGANGTTVKFTSANGSVNVSHGANAGIGVSNNLLGGETLRLTFSSVVAGLSVIVNDVNAGETLTFRIYDGNGSLIASASAPAPANAVKSPALDGVVYNFANYFTGQQLSGGFQAVEITGHSDRDPVRISNFSVDEPLFPDTKAFEFNVAVIDGDLDVASASFNVTISADLNPQSAGGYLLVGSSGKAESIQGGSGDDIIRLSDLVGDTIDGGGGRDTLVLNGVLDLRGAPITNVEAIDMKGGAIGDTVILSAADVLSFNGEGTIQVKGDAGDRVVLEAGDTWTPGAVVDGFVHYSAGTATLLVETGIVVQYTDGSSV